MFFVTFEYSGAVQAGVLNKEKTKVIPLREAEEFYFGTTNLVGSLLELIRKGDLFLDTIKEIMDYVERADDCPFLLDLEKVTLKAPIPRPEKNIFCLGKNYREHALEFDKTGNPDLAIPKHPVIFTKSVSAVTHPGDAILSHQDITSMLDYEAELAVVIGKTGYNISKENAMEYVFGFTILNDVTARDLQQKHLQWHRGKSLDTFAPMGPYLVHKSALPHFDNLHITSKINGELRQNANTNQLMFDIPTIISTLSEGMTLDPGDIIATGTPAGVGMGFNPPKFLQPGDVVEIEISGIGVLKNTVK